jgi:hypothetical protein
MSDPKCWYAGVDWGSQSHCVFLTDDQGRKLGQRFFKHSGDGLAEMATWLLKTSGADQPGQVLVAIEVPRGPVAESLIERGFAVHAINPKQMDRFRDRFSMAGAKDHGRDAEVMASSPRTDIRCFRRLASADPVLVELREGSRIAEELGVERNRLANLGAKFGLGWHIQFRTAYSGCADVYVTLLIMADICSGIVRLPFVARDRLLIWRKGFIW